MAFPRPIGRPDPRRGLVAARTEDAPTVAALIAAAGVLVLTLTLPRGLVLPGLSILLIAVAFGLAALSGAGPDGRPSASRDVSAALAFIGFGAALITDPEPVLALLEGSRRACVSPSNPLTSKHFPWTSPSSSSRSRRSSSSTSCSPATTPSWSAWRPRGSTPRLRAR